MTPERPLLSYRTTGLLPLQPAHLQWLREQELGEALAMRWRHHGRHPSPAEFEDAVWSCLCSFLVVGTSLQRQPVGIVSAYDHDPNNQHVKVAAASFTENLRGALTVRGALMLIDYLFHAWPIRKIYFESADYNAHQFARSDHDALVLEGRLTSHIHLGGQYHDLLIFALERSNWQRVRTRYFRVGAR